MGPFDIEEFRSGGVLPTGPVSAWPKSRNEEIEAREEERKAMARAKAAEFQALAPEERATKVKAGLPQQAGGLLKNTQALFRGGTVSKEIRNERYDMCKACPSFIEASKRCADCGCFMEAKTWINDKPKNLCPKNKWVR